MTIYSYIDSLLDMWCSWNDIFLTQQLHSKISNLNEMLNSSGSDKPSRAKEMYRIGLLKKELSKGDDAWDTLRKGENLQTRLGFISAVMRQAMIIDPENSSLRKGFSSLCAIYSVIQSERINNTELSIATIAIDLLNRFPNNSEYSDLTWLRYILSAFYCELEESAEDLEKMFLSSTVIPLRILEKDKGVLKCRATFTNSEDVDTAIRSNISLTNIIKQKSALFAIGEVSVNSCRGFLGQAYLSCKALLCAMHDLEMSAPGLLQPIHIESNASQKPYVFDFLNNLAAQHQSFNQEYNKIMKNIAEGAREALEVLFPKDANGNNASGVGLQVIYYGAPGTGKSNKIEECTSDSNRIRTTFHPDSDYSTFVGAYKPTMEETGVTVAGKKETRIAYKYVPQAFLKAYVNAWDLIEKSENSPYYLVIEEINRGNCAQIFGDLFQLLDRGDNGESKYAICPDDDIKRYLAEEFKNATNIPEAIKKGEEMRLPSNLYIWATMNTSDQSLFPIDSAFKRRWDWEYMPIEKGNKEYVIEIGANKYDWWKFISIINSKIDEITGSEDKKLGYWFAKPAGSGTIISCNQFVSKVLFYLWNDVYKDYADDNRSIFRIQDGSSSKRVAFTEFFGSERDAKLHAFMNANGIEPETSSVENSDIDTAEQQ